MNQQRPKENTLCCKLKRGSKIAGKIGGLPVSLKVDTGSVSTFITTKTYKNIPYKFRPGLKPSKRKFAAANGSTFTCDGETTILMELDGAEVYFPVLVGGVDENLLGQDFIQHFHCQLDFQNRRMFIKTGGVEEVPNIQRRTKRLARVVAAETTEIPAEGECLISVKFRDTPISGDGILIQDDTFLKRHHVVLARSLVNSGQSIFYARLLNPNKDIVHIPKGTVIALFERVRDGEISETVYRIQQAPSENILPSHLEEMFKESSSELQGCNKDKFRDLLIRKQEAFAGPGQVGRCNLGKHRIVLTDDKPIKESPRRIPLYKRDVIEEQVKNLEQQGFIEKSDSPYSAQTVLVKKKDGNWRMCVDYRKLNEKTVKDAYPLPRVEDNLDSLSGASLFSTLDCNMAYHQIEVDERDKMKTAFATPTGGLYHYITMPFGLCNAPATFQRVAEKALEGLQWKVAVLYLDDIIVYSHDFDSHIRNLETVLDRLISSGLRLKPAKCRFFKPETGFLGHVISRDGVKPDPSKVEVIKNLKSPACVKELRSFLGLTSYYRKFMKDYSEIAKPLYLLTRKDVTWNWSEEAEKAFQMLKEKLINYPILAYPKVDGGEFTLDCDASSSSIGAVLSQEQDGSERVIAYASRTLSAAECNYCVTKLEMLAVVFFTKYFKHYLLGRHFTVRSDHGSLRWLSRFKEPEGQVQRWLEQLSQFDFEIIHRPGTKHRNADFLSRVTQGESVLCRQCKLPLTTETPLTEGAIVSEELVKESGGILPVIGVLYDEDEDSDYDMREELLEEQIREGSRIRQAERPRRKRGRKANRPEPAVQKPEPQNELTVEKLKEYQEQDSDISYIRRLKLEGANKPDWATISGKSKDVKFWIARWDLLAIHGDLLCIKWEYSEADVRWRVCIPQNVIPFVMWYIHDAHVSGHLGIRKSHDRAKQCPFFWSCMSQSVADYVRSCQLCGEANNPVRSKRHFLQKYTVGHRFERIAMDIAGPFPRSESGSVYTLVIGDYFTKLVEMFPLKDITATTIAECVVRGWIKRYGCPREIHSDQGRQFESALFQEVCKLLEINKTRTTPLHARSDGFIERMNRTIQNILSKFVHSDQRDWDTHLDFIMMAYNSSPQESTGFSPYRLLYGEEITLPLDLLAPRVEEQEEPDCFMAEYVSNLQIKIKHAYSLVEENLHKAAVRQKKQYDMNVKAFDYSVGDLVWRNQKQALPGVKTKIKRHWTGPWKITQKLCDVLFRIQNARNTPSVVIHGDNLKKYYGEKLVDLDLEHTGQATVQVPELQEFTQQHISPASIENPDIDYSLIRGYENSEDESNGGDLSVDESEQNREPFSRKEQSGRQPNEKCQSKLAQEGAEGASARDARVNGGFSAETRDNAGKGFHSLSSSRRGRQRFRPKHLRDFVSRISVSFTMPYFCDTCGRSYSNKRNLNRHMKEKHDDNLHFKCPEAGCATTFTRRSNVNKHLCTKHRMDRRQAKAIVSQLVLSAAYGSSDSENRQRTPVMEVDHSKGVHVSSVKEPDQPLDSVHTVQSTPLPLYEDISDDDTVLDDISIEQHTPVLEADVSAGISTGTDDKQFEEWMDQVLSNSGSCNSPAQLHIPTDSEIRDFRFKYDQPLGELIKAQRESAQAHNIVASTIDDDGLNDLPPSPGIEVFAADVTADTGSPDMESDVSVESPHVATGVDDPSLDVGSSTGEANDVMSSDGETIRASDEEQPETTRASDEKQPETTRASDEEQPETTRASDEEQPEMIDVSDDEEEESVREDVDFVNFTLRTATRYCANRIVDVDRTISVAYSDNFNPENYNPVEVFQRIQDHINASIAAYNK